MTRRLGMSPPQVCTCGHPPAEHLDGPQFRGMCVAMDKDEWGYDSCCPCWNFELDGDR